MGSLIFLTDKFGDLSLQLPESSEVNGRPRTRVATVHNMVKKTIRAHLILVHVFHAYALVHTPWVAHVLSHCTPIRYGRIASVSAAHEAT
jgi:hypothetical protein